MPDVEFEQGGGSKPVQGVPQQTLQELLCFTEQATRAMAKEVNEMRGLLEEIRDDMRASRRRAQAIHRSSVRSSDALIQAIDRLTAAITTTGGP